MKREGDRGEGRGERVRKRKGEKREEGKRR